MQGFSAKTTRARELESPEKLRAGRGGDSYSLAASVSIPPPKPMSNGPPTLT